MRPSIVVLLALPLIAADSSGPAPLPDATPSLRGAMNTSATQRLKGKVFVDRVRVDADAGTAFSSSCVVNSAALGACPAGNGLQCVLDAGWYACSGGSWTPVNAGGGGVSTISADPPLLSSGGTTPLLSCIPASNVVGGCLTAGAQLIGGPKTFTNDLTAIAVDAGSVRSGNFMSPQAGLWLAESFGCSGTCFDFITDAPLNPGVTLAQFSNNFTPGVTLVTSASGVDIHASAGNFFGSGTGSLGDNGGSFALFGSVSPSGDIPGTLCDVVETSRFTRDAGCLFGIANQGDDQWFINYQGGMEPLNKWVLNGFGVCGDNSHRDGTMQHPGDTYGIPWYQCQALSDAGLYTDGGGWYPIPTTANGLVGGSIEGYWPGGSGHAVNVARGMRLQRAIVQVGALVGRIGITITTAGTVGGTFDLMLVDTTTATTLCQKTGNSCTSSVGTLAAACPSGIGAAGGGDDLELRIDTTSCSGNSPAGNVFVDW